MSFSEYYVPKVDIKYFNVLIDGKPFFEIPVKNKEEACEAIIEMSKNNDYTTGNLLDYEYFKDHYKLIAIDLSKQIKLENADLKQQIILLEGSKKIMQQCSLLCSCCLIYIKMETQKVLNLLNDSDNDLQNLQQENGILLMIKIMGNMAEEMKMMQPLNMIQKSLIISHYTYIFVTGDIKVAGVAANTNVAFKNCAPFTRCVTHINDEHVETAEKLDIIMPMYNLIEYSDNYADSSGRLCQFKRDESPMNDAGNILNFA